MFLLVAVVLVMHPGAAESEEESGRWIHVGVGAMFAFAGDTGLEFKGSGSDSDFGYTITYGADLQVDFRISRYLFAGMDLRTLWWNTVSADEYDIDRSMTVEFGPNIKLGSEYQPGFFLYCRACPGFSIAFPENILPCTSADCDWNMGAGVHIAVLCGMNVDVISILGILFEIGYIHRYIVGSVDSLPYGSDAWSKDKYTLNGGQFHLNVGLYF